MNERVEELIMDYLKGSLSEQDRIEWETLLEDGVVNPSDIEEYKVLFSDLDQIGEGEPSKEMNVGFYKLINEKLGKSNRYTLLDQFAAFLYQKGLSRGGIQAAYSLIVLTFGLGVGYLMIGKADRNEIVTLSSEVKEMKAMMMLSLLEKESPSTRIKAVSMAQDMPDVNTEIIDALFATLNADINTNVRLEALDALVMYASKPEVRSGLIKAMSYQTNPLVQLALADIMVILQDKGAKEVLNKLLQQEDIPADVKDQIEQRYNAIKI